MNPWHDCTKDGGHFCRTCIVQVMEDLAVPNMTAVNFNTLGFKKEKLYVGIGIIKHLRWD